MNKKTKEEIELIKLDWLSDPIWDLEDTEGFESHKEELLAFSISSKKKWAFKRTKDDLLMIIKVKRHELNTLENILALIEEKEDD